MMRPKARSFVLPAPSALLPASKEEDGSFFITKEELEQELEEDPENLGFEKTRARIEGKQPIGYWAKYDT